MIRNAETRLYELGARVYYDLWLENSGSREVRLMALRRRFGYANRVGG